VLAQIDQYLGDLFEFNKELVLFDGAITDMDIWINGRAQVYVCAQSFANPDDNASLNWRHPQEKLETLRQPEVGDVAPDPEERVTRGMELMEDLLKRIQVCSSSPSPSSSSLPRPAARRRKPRRRFSQPRAKKCQRMQKTLWIV
jgi:hypothetical protein